MRFSAPPDVQFEIPDEWWAFADMDKFSPRTDYYIYSQKQAEIQIVPLAGIKPPTRSPGTPWFKKYKLMPIFFAFQSPECELSPIEVLPVDARPYRFKVYNGFHRYYASIAAGYTQIPIVVVEIHI